MSKQNNPNTLPPKELSIFKRVVKYYDQKQYKNGLKCARQILGNPKYAEHGETLAMKGILLNCLGKKEEAREYVKRGLKANISSFVCWHIYGLIQKSDRKYDEAIKCYLQALRLDNDNLQVLRDLSVLQMQLRNYEGCKETRYKLLMLRPSQRASWIGYALTHHLLGNYDTALTILGEFQKGQSDTAPGYESSELIMYQVMIMLESNKHEKALTYLNEHFKEIVDVVSALETKTQLLLELGQLDAAKECAWELVERNMENGLYFDYLSKANGASGDPSAENMAIRRKTLEEVLERYPRSRLAKRLILQCYTGDEFAKHLDAYLRCHMRKGAPPLFKQLENLWSNPQNTETLERLLNQYQSNIKEKQSFDADGSEKEPPSTSIWLNYFIAQYLNYKKDYKGALGIIDSQLEVTPTLVDFYVLKADVFYSAGDVITASRWMEEAQSLDTADRYINARCTKFMVQAHRQEDAVAMASKFTRGNTSAADYLSEMQCMWFLTENARTLKDLCKYGEALKLCHEVEQHYRNILDDQLDFHSYCLRKGTLRAYIETLRLEDRLRDHPSYFEVAKLAIEIYIHLFAHPVNTNDSATEGTKGTMSTSEAKKLRNKQRKAARRAEAEAAKARAEQERKEQALRSRQPPGDDADPDRPVAADVGLDPKVLGKPDDPLEEACKFLRPLLDLAPKRIEVHCLAYEIYERKRKWLLMLKSIMRGMALPGSQNHTWFHACCVRFLLQLQQNSDQLRADSASPVYRVLIEEVPKLFEGWPDAPTSLPSTFNDEFLLRNKLSFPHVFRAVLLRALIEPAAKTEHLANLPVPSDGLLNTTWEECASALNLLKTADDTVLGSIDPSVLEKFRLACAHQFPMSIAFLTDAERDELRTKMIAEGAATAVCGLYTNYQRSDMDHSGPKGEADEIVTDALEKLHITNKLVNGEVGDVKDEVKADSDLHSSKAKNLKKNSQSAAKEVPVRPTVTL
ncbi:unnamed protein product [Calicophoron daubneyi]|uniref:Uncharacterized protein n=1 Tax=Calicophoron daubneyi TaxID=300641 RepID=A0AAV2THL9_CALDB